MVGDLFAQSLGSSLMINEVSVSNNSVIKDDHGEFSDWIEIYNPTPNAISLDGWYLTDDATVLNKWQFPSRILHGGQFLVVFATGKNQIDSVGTLHTNFKLKKEGEYLALVKNDGFTIVHQFEPGYGVQRDDVSFGIVQKATPTTLVDSNVSGKLLVPDVLDDNEIKVTWTGVPANEPFNDSNWLDVMADVGYDTRNSSSQNQNIALRKPTIQSSNFGGFPSQLGTDALLNNFTHTATGDLSPWWEVDLRKTFIIDSVVIHNRIDCCQERLNNLVVKIFDAVGNTVYESDTLNPIEDGGPAVNPGPFLTLDLSSEPLGGISGHKIQISKQPASGTAEYLTLAEVEVFGFENYAEIFSSDVQAQMKGVNASSYLRLPFMVDNPQEFNSLLLNIRYDDGFVAYLNGIEIARANVPDDLSYNSHANDEHLAENLEMFQVPVSLLQTGKNVLAIHALNHSIDDDHFLISPKLVAYEIESVGTGYFLEPTPGHINNSSVDGFVDDPIVDKIRGFYDSPFNLKISNSTPGATLVYTIDGSEPSLTNGTKILPPDPNTSPPTVDIPINSTTVIRIAGFKSAYEMSGIVTHTYIFLNQVVSSPVMDKTITQDPKYASKIYEGLTDLPSISLVVPPNTINDTDPVAASIEWMQQDNVEKFQENAGVRYFGGAFTNFDKKNFRFYFKRKYGNPKLKYPLFKGFDRGIKTVEVFDQLELRAGSHDMVQRGFYMSNRFTDDTMLDMGNLNPHGRFVHLYINGVYWGQYHLRERWNADMHAQYLGGSKEDYEAINGNWNQGGWAVPGIPYDGDGSVWEHVKSLRNDYKEIKAYLDVPHYIDYMLMFMFGNSEDEYRCVGPVNAGSGFKWFLNDADGFLRDAGNRTDMAQPGRRSADGPGSIFSMLLKEGHPEYKKLLGDRIHEHFFNNGALTPNNNRKRLLERCDEVERSIIAESARWGYRTPESWENAKNDYINDVLPFRTATVIQHFRNAGFYPNIDAPRFKINNLSNHGGVIRSGDELSMIADKGTIFYTTDGTDPYNVPETASTTSDTIINESAQKTVLIPSATLPVGWNSSVDFDVTTWKEGSGNPGYEQGSGYENLIGIDVSEMYNQYTSCLIRIPFSLTSSQLEKIESLFLLMRYDDGFVAYINGQEIQRINAEGIPDWNTNASISNEAGDFRQFNVSKYINVLQEGKNILAIHGLNVAANSSDFIISCELISDESVIENTISPSAIEFSTPLLISEDVEIQARTIFEGEWSALSKAIFTIDSSVITGIDTAHNKKSIDLIANYPNPFQGSCIIEFRINENVLVTLEVYNAFGVKVWEKGTFATNQNVNSIVIQPQNWNSGLYIFKLRSQSGHIVRGKFIYLN
ncbi:CotH kinase family protein [Fulvivirgaceae bacterium BMA10]|uniref:CotH kinase family protein n=2 Tax=Splendidivirga corallicola TaxID=3051826 RepID=A0ABT8KNE3_9BACT|nr:CotH kinase family protein [Fulvivirgaceae bacterium BMA10]